MIKYNISVILIIGMIIAASLLTALHYIIKQNKKGKCNNTVYKRNANKIVFREGMDVERQTKGSNKGEYFSGEIDEYDTYVVKHSEIAQQQIALQDCKNGKVYKIRMSHRIYIGRCKNNSERENKLVLEQDEKISREHCMIYTKEGALYIRDLNSSNHTYVNANRILTDVKLQNGDIIKIGSTKLCLRIGR